MFQKSGCTSHAQVCGAVYATVPGSKSKSNPPPSAYATSHMRKYKAKVNIKISAATSSTLHIILVHKDERTDIHSRRSHEHLPHSVVDYSYITMLEVLPLQHATEHHFTTS
ncbi:unnamed protein product [Ceratitis capitata]|uniref:(Mediterranean fruit fly) hypothetical protein n=1 Tax=Ceratitis capitata TaxID=7213 RepID=A0A811V4S8_CERCA|nr:unnamed protein product [Ceratitis capitata]